MAKKASKKPDTRAFTAIVRLKWGKGRKALSIDIPVDLVLDHVWVRDPSDAMSLKADLRDHAVDEQGNMQLDFSVVNMKEYVAAYKARVKERSSANAKMED